MLGDKLRAERERQNLTIKDIEQGTSIRALYIECIEKGEYESLPGEVYTKGFIRNYATFLKLDADAFVQEFNQERHPEAVLQAQEQAAEEPTAKEDSFEMGSDFKVSLEESANRQNKLLIAVICLLVLGGAYFLFASGDDGQVAKAPQQVKQETAVKKEAPKAEQTKVAAVPAKRDDVEVVAKFDDRCWTQVIADGKTLLWRRARP